MTNRFQSALRKTEPVVDISLFAKSDVGHALLRPRMIELRLRQREQFQLTKFRTNCSDCVPNL
jgi:hypothetical protein